MRYHFQVEGAAMYKVIIVDDEKNIRERMAKFLPWDEFDFEVIGTAKDGLAALELVKSLEPDLILSDIKMPNIDGIQLAEQLHRHYPEVVTVFISSYNEFELAQKAIRFNVKGYLLKPVMKNDFRELMSGLSKQGLFQVSKEVLKVQVHKPENTSEYMDKARKYLFEHYAENITLKDVADELYIHEAYFSKLFNQEIGEGFNAFVNGIRIERAKEQLMFSNKQLKDISNEVGFSSSSYFNRVFKQKVGVSPLTFRKTSQKND